MIRILGWSGIFLRFFDVIMAVNGVMHGWFLTGERLRWNNWKVHSFEIRQAQQDQTKYCLYSIFSNPFNSNHRQPLALICLDYGKQLWSGCWLKRSPVLAPCRRHSRKWVTQVPARAWSTRRSWSRSDRETQAFQKNSCQVVKRL